LIRQMLHAKQTGPVSEYVDRFSTLVDQLAAYDSHPNPLYYTMRFIDGLKEEYCPAVLLHRPRTVDTAFVLAQLQEEVYDPGKRKEIKKPDFSFAAKPAFKSAYPLPAPPPKQDKPQHPSEVRKTSAEEKWQALHRFRRAKGLCEKCAAKWSRDHVCSESVQLHVIQDMLDIFEGEDMLSQSGEESQSPGELFMTLSLAAISLMNLLLAPCVCWVPFRGGQFLFWSILAVPILLSVLLWLLNWWVCSHCLLQYQLKWLMVRCCLASPISLLLNGWLMGVVFLLT